ncbi:MAG: hypothetical protein AAF533_14235 [Acidobacteriota bacterium]
MSDQASSTGSAKTPDEERRWRRRLPAALVGGTLLAFTLGAAASIHAPGHDGLDQAMQGGLLLVLVWPVAMLWALLAPSRGAAWKRVLLPAAVFLVVDVVSLLT